LGWNKKRDSCHQQKQNNNTNYGEFDKPHI